MKNKPQRAQRTQRCFAAAQILATSEGNIQRKDAETQRNRPFLHRKNTILRSSLTQRGARYDYTMQAPLWIKELLRIVTLSFAQRGRFCSAELVRMPKICCAAKHLCVLCALCGFSLRKAFCSAELFRMPKICFAAKHLCVLRVLCGFINYQRLKLSILGTTVISGWTFCCMISWMEERVDPIDEKQEVQAP